MNDNLSSFTDILIDESCESQPISLSPSNSIQVTQQNVGNNSNHAATRPAKHTGQYGQFRSIEEIDEKYRSVFTYPFFNLVQSKIIEDALYSDKSMVVCAPTGSGKTVVFEMAIVQLLMKLDDMNYTDDFKIIYMAPVKAVCSERLSEWYPKFTRLGLLCIEVTGDTDVDFSKLQPYRIIITTPEKWDVLTRRWTDYRGLVGVIKLFLIDEVHILNDETRGPTLEAVVSRMKTIEASSQSAYRIEKLQQQQQHASTSSTADSPPRIRFVAVSATVSNPDDVATWLGTEDSPAVYHKYGDECRPVKLKRIVEGYPCSEGTSIFKFDIILSYKLWPIIQKYYDGKPTLIFCNTRKSVVMTAEALSRELTITFNPEQKAKLMQLASNIKNKKLQSLVMNGVGLHHAGLLYEERVSIEQGFRQRDLPILITTTTLAMGVNLPAHLVIIKNTQQYVNGSYQEYSISTVLQMVGRAGRPQFDTEATAVIMTRMQDKARYQALVGGCEPLQSYLHKRLTENLNSEAALGTVGDVAQCVQWLRSTFLYVRAGKDPRRYLNVPQNAPPHVISKKIEELCVKAMNGLASAGLITMDEASCIESTEAGTLMSVYYLDFETMKIIMKLAGCTELPSLLLSVCESHELADLHLRVEERRTLNALNRNSQSAAIRFPMKGKITTRQMKLNCLIQAVLGCLPIPDPSLNQEAMKIMRIAARICKCMVAYLTRPNLLSHQPQYYSTILNSVVLAKCMSAQLWENSPFVSRQLKGIGPTYSNSLATAGKVNFMLLEESHPRDLERIMNKGPPAGNIIRKQISLLPKYKLTITPVDEKTVTIQLMLMNQSYLSENMDNLTAGDSHKSYVIVGDSENHIILLTTFVDKTLIKVYDGTLTFSVTRKHRCEHKIMAHCISSTYVGIDDHCDYLFKDLDPMPVCLPPTVTDSQRNIVSKQTNITDTFKERKRRGNNSIEISQCKEKKRRENALFEKLKLLKRSFNKTTKSLQEELNETTMSDLIPAEFNDKEFPDYTNSISEELNEPTMSNFIPSELNEKEFIDFTNSMSEDVKAFEEDEEFEVLNYSKTGTIPTDCQYIDSIMNEYPEMDTEDGKFIDNGHINSILTEIENEISKKPEEPYLPEINLNENNKHHINGPLNLKPPSSKVIHPKMGKPGNEPQHQDSVKFQRTENYKVKNGLSRNTKRLNNYSFLDKIGNSSDDEVITEKPVTKESGFSNAIKSHIQKFLQKSNNKVGMDSAVVIQKLLEPVSSAQTESIEEHSNTTHNETVLVSDNTEGDCILIENSQNRSSNLSEKDMHTENICLDKPSQNSLIDIIDQPIEINDIDQAVQPIDRTHDGNLEKDLTGIGNLFRSLSTSEKNEDVDTTIQGCYTLALNDKVYSDKTVNDTILNSDNKVEDACTDSIVIAGSQNRPSSTDELQKNDTTTEQYFKPIHPMINNKCSSSFAKPVPINSNHEECVETNAIQLQESSHALVPVKLQEFNSRAAILPKHYNQQVELYFKPEKLKNLEEYRNEGNMGRILVSEQYKLNSNQIHQYSELVTGTQHTSSFSLDSRNRDGNAVPIHGNCEKHVTINNLPYTENENMDFSKEISSPSTIPYCPAMQNNNFERIYEEECQPDINTKFESKKPKIMYTQKYSYVTTEIDIWTKNNSDENCTVKVIKKMEVNVAAIVSKDSNKKTYFSSDKKDKHIPLVRQAKPFEIKTNTSGLQTEEIISEPKNKISYFIGNLNYSDTPSDRLATPLEIETKTSEIQEDPNNTNEGSIWIENNFQHENKMTEIKREKCTSENGPSAVDNLLKKYTNILKEKAEQENCRTIQKHIPENKTNSQKSKPKRPFKISDIDRIDATLPNTLIDMTPRTITPILDEGRNMIYKHTIDQKSVREPDFHQSMPIMEMKHEDPILNYSEPIVDNDNEISFNIDQSLLNPKSLLQQCYKNLDENEIIPPPSQFCDDTVYSPKKESNFYSDQSPAPHMLHNELESYCDTADEFDAKTYLDAVQRSCYDNSEHEHSESTPSTNMVVWNLGTDEDACTSLPSFVRASDNFIPASKFNIGYNRKQKLDRYQLNTKAKFKVSRNKL